MSGVTSVTTGSNLVPVHSNKTQELAAVVGRLLDLRQERRNTLTKINTEIKDLEKRADRLVGEIRAGGAQLDLELFPDSTRPPVEDVSGGKRKKGVEN